MAKGTVLVVDNDDTAQFIVTGVLRDAGFGVVRVYDAASALRVEAALHLDAAVTSSNVPGMEGTALLRAMREQNPDLTLIFVTDRPTRDTEAQATRDGASGYCCKPLVAADLHRAGIEAIIVGREARERRLRLAGERDRWH